MFPLSEPSVKSVLTKLFNINLYTMIFLEDYKGPELPAHMNAEKYADVGIQVLGVETVDCSF